MYEKPLGQIMSKKIYTIQSADKNEFDKEVNSFLELGCELLEGGYEVMKKDEGAVYHQVIVFNKKWYVEFYDSGQIKQLSTLNWRGNGRCTDWID